MKYLFLFALVVSGAAIAHGNIDVKNGACTLKISELNSVHLSAYQPFENEGEVYCESVPELAETFIVIDFMEEDLKKRPVAFSISYGEGDKSKVLASSPLKLNPQGSILLKFNPVEKGKYHGQVVSLDEDGHDASRGFDFYIGELGPNSKEASLLQTSLRYFLILLFFVGGGYILFIKRVVKEE